MSPASYTSLSRKKKPMPSIYSSAVPSVSPHLSPATPSQLSRRTSGNPNKHLQCSHARPQSSCRTRDASPGPAASRRVPSGLGCENPRHEPHVSCWAPFCCLPRFFCEHKICNGSGKPFRAQSNRRPSAAVTAYHQVK